MAQNILLLSENFPPKSGGSGRWFWELYSRLQVPQGGKIYILTDENDEPEGESTHENFELIRIPFSSTEWGFKSVTGIKFYWRTAKLIRSLVKQYGITQIHCGRVIHEGVIAWLVSKFTKVQYLCYIHGEDIETAAVSREHDLMVKQVCKGACKLICNSQNSLQIAKRLNYALSDDQLSVLYPGVNSSRFIPAEPDFAFRQKLGWDNKFVLLTVGRLQERKGHDKMIEAMSSIISAIPDFIYVIIGEGECKNSLVAQSIKLGISEHVQFLSELDDKEMIMCYQQCDLFILPNRTIGNDIEGFGMVLVEAQSCAKPVIAGDSGGTKETMLEGETGYIIDCTQSAIIADKIIELSAVPFKLEQMGVKGREHVVNSLDWDAHVINAQRLFFNS